MASMSRAYAAFDPSAHASLFGWVRPATSSTHVSTRCVPLMDAPLSPECSNVATHTHRRPRGCQTLGEITGPAARPARSRPRARARDCRTGATEPALETMEKYSRDAAAHRLDRRRERKSFRESFQRREPRGALGTSLRRAGLRGGVAAAQSGCPDG